MFQIKIHPVTTTSKLLSDGKSKKAFEQRLKICQKYRIALLEDILDHFDNDKIEETLYLKYYATNDKIKKDYSFIKDKEFKRLLRQYIEELHCGIGFIF